jgi:hypothetical protein
VSGASRGEACLRCGAATRQEPRGWRWRICLGCGFEWDVALYPGREHMTYMSSVGLWRKVPDGLLAVFEEGET